MNKYEMLYILSAKLEEETVNNVVEKFQSIVTSNGGAVEKTDKWGVKKLAYAINYENEGFYVLMTFESEPTLVAEITRVANITEGMLRCMITKLA